MNGQWCILICQEKWVIAGVVYKHPQDSLKLLINECFTIRVWGTTKGIGELAIDGPTETGKYDYEGDGIEQNQAFVMRIIPCTEKASKKWTQLTSSFMQITKKK